MDNRSADLAIVLPCRPGQEDAVYRVIASLSLQTDRRFVIYAFFEEGDGAMRALLEDHAEGGIDLLLRPVPILPDPALSPLPERCRFYAGSLRRESFVNFSDGRTLYNPDCIRAFQKRLAGHRRVEEFHWRFSLRPAPKLSGCARQSLRVLLGWEQLPLCAKVFRLSELERLLTEEDQPEGNL